MRHTIRDLPADRVTVSPSLLAADFGHLAREIRRVTEAGADLLHLDIMDGHFVPNLSFGPPVVAAIRPLSQLVFDTHLMLSHPGQYAEAFIRSGADHITFHVECLDPVDRVIDAVHQAGASVGLSLKPATPAEAVFPWLDRIDLVLVMSVEPGFGGQSFMRDQMPKVRALRRAIDGSGRKIQLEIDGGIDEHTVGEALDAGANMLVAGTAVFRHQAGAAEAIRLLHRGAALPGEF